MRPRLRLIPQLRRRCLFLWLRLRRCLLLPLLLLLLHLLLARLLARLCLRMLLHLLLACLLACLCLRMLLRRLAARLRAGSCLHLRPAKLRVGPHRHPIQLAAASAAARTATSACNRCT
jgi:hypothetical protein